MVQKFSLVVVSNRLPFVLKRDGEGNWTRKSSAGGLVTAVAPVVVDSNGYWVGWPGLGTSDLTAVPESSEGDKSPTAGLRSEKVLMVDLSHEEHELYYNKLCNGNLWPIFHSMPDRATFDREAWEAYKAVNDKFADKTLEALEKVIEDEPDKTPIVWIQDLHLMLVADRLREMAAKKGLNCVIAFFLHIPFPAFDLFKIMPWEQEILEGLLACDVLGFHHDDYCLNFLDSCARSIGYRVDYGEKRVERNDGRFVFAKTLPISIPFDRFEQLARLAPEELLHGQVKIVLGVDRLDYTKGLPNRLLAWERLLERFPEHQEKVMLLQIAVPSRTDVPEYQELKENMDKLVGSINGRFSTATWSPIRYIYDCVPQTKLAGYYRDADVALITPLRDGMNLVAKEFVACRVDDDNPGVLVLSPFAGAGRSMEEALLVNPYEVENVAETLDRALKMGDKERKIRMRGLRAREETNDVFVWVKRFTKGVSKYLETRDNLKCEHGTAFETHFAPLIKAYKRFVFLLDFDGTLTPLVSHPDLAVLPSGTKKLLLQLADRGDVDVAIVSGRQVDDVRSKVGIEGITYSGSHGNVIEFADGERYENSVNAEKVDELEAKLEERVCRRFEGVWLENKEHTICVHTRHVQGEDLLKEANEAIAETAKGEVKKLCLQRAYLA